MERDVKEEQISVLDEKPTLIEFHQGHQDKGSVTQKKINIAIKYKYIRNGVF